MEPNSSNESNETNLAAAPRAPQSQPDFNQNLTPAPVIQPVTSTGNNSYILPPPKVNQVILTIFLVCAIILGGVWILGMTTTNVDALSIFVQIEFFGAFIFALITGILMASQVRKSIAYSEATAQPINKLMIIGLISAAIGIIS